MKEKVKVAVPEIVLKVLKKDQQHFDMKKEKLCNEILLKFSRENLNYYYDIKFNGNGYLQFNLNKSNRAYFEELSKKIKGKSDSEKIRKIFCEYAILQPYIRETILFWEKIVTIDSFEKSKKALKLAVDGKIIESKIGKIFVDDEKSYLMITISGRSYYLSKVKILK